MPSRTGGSGPPLPLSLVARRALNCGPTSGRQKRPRTRSADGAKRPDRTGLLQPLYTVRYESGPRCCVRYRLILQQPHKVHTVPVGLLQLSAGIDPALIPIRHYLEHHPWVGLRLPSFGRIGAIQFPVVQFLKLGACQPDGCVLW